MAFRKTGELRRAAPIRAMIVGGDPTERTRFRRLVGGLSGIELLADADSLPAAVDLIRTQAPDVVFIDAGLADFAGPTLLPTAGAAIPVVVVADDAVAAAEAFRRGAVDFLLRPLTRAALVVAVSRLEAVLNLRPSRKPPGAADDETVAATPTGPREATLSIDDRVAVSLERGRSVDLVPVSEIVWIESLQNYTRLQLVGRKPVVIKRTLSDWEAMLPPEHFGRISRSIVIQLTRLRSSLWRSRDETLLAFEGIDDRLTIGRSAAARLKELFRGPGAG